MRILLSAFACDPDRGSEPAVGWNWAVRLARMGHEVWVITAAESARQSHERSIAEEDLQGQLNFVYYPHSRFPTSFAKTHFGYNLFIQTWQLGALRVAKHLHRRIHFDCVHHVTFASIRLGSLMGHLKIPFTFGPVAGGVSVPRRLRAGFSFGAKAKEILRDLSNWAIKFNPIVRSAFRRASRIIVTDTSTAELVPRRYRSKCSVVLAIGHDEEVLEFCDESDPDPIFRILYAGMFQSLKGVHFAIRAFAEFHRTHPTSHFTLIGKGPEESRLRALAEQLGVSKFVTWHNWLPREKVLSLYSSHDVLLFPSMRDSGGMVVLEALARALPVICLNLGGPGTIVDESCGIVIDAKRASEEQVISHMASALSELHENKHVRKALSQGALRRAQRFQWDNLVRTFYSPIEQSAIQMELQL